MNAKPPKIRKSGKAAVISIGSQSAFFTRKANDKLDEGDFLSALRYYRRALACVPFDSKEGRELCLMIADTYLDMDCAVEASAWVAPLLRPDIDEFRPAVLRLGHCLASRGELRAALDCFDFSLSAKLTTEPLQYNDALNAIEAEDFCEEYLDDEKRSEPILRDVDEIEAERIANDAAALSENADFTAAIALLEPAHARFPEDARIFTDLLLDYYCEQRFADGLKLFDSVSDKLKNEFTVQCCAAMLCHQLGQKERAQALAEKISEFKLTDPNELVRAYTVMMEIELFDKAIVYAESMTAQEPYNRTFMHFLAHAAYEAGDAERAKNCYAQNLIVEPNDSVAYFYKKVCEETLAGGERRRFQIEYAVPHSEFIARCKLTEELVGYTREELEDFWHNEPKTMLRLVNWAMTDRNCPFGDLYIVFLLLVDFERTERLLRRLLVEPDCSPVMRRLAAAHLQSDFSGGRKDFRFVMLSDGRARICALGDSVVYNDFPQCYRYIFETVAKELEKNAEELMGPALMLCKLYTLAHYKHKPQLPYGQKEAMAAAIVYFVLAHSHDRETPELSEFAAAHGVTVRRIENAIDRLLELPELSENASGQNPFNDDGDDDE